MNTETFEELLSKMKPFIEKNTTIMRMPIKADEKLAVTLHFSATGESFESLQYQFRIHKSTICKFVPCVCEAIYKTLKGDYFNFPASQEEPLPKSKDSSWTQFESYEEVPFVFVADNAFPLSNIYMKPYPENGSTDRKRVFNYRLSRFRRVTENAFGILTSVFRIFSTKINMHPDRATSVILASLVLHNMLRTKSSDSYTPKGIADEIQGDMVVDGQWRDENSDRNMQPLPPRRHGNNNAKEAAELRDIFADHFYGPGQVPWQWNHIMAKK
eukprot:gene3927-15253_t